MWLPQGCLGADMHVYLISNTVNEKIYIGQTVRTLPQRFACHKSIAKNSKCPSAVHLAMRKYGISNFSIHSLQTCHSQDELNKVEIAWIAEFDSVTPNGYNLLKGGRSEGKSRTVRTGFTVSRETAAKISKTLTGHGHSGEVKKKISSSLKGRVISDEVKLKMSQAQIGLKRKPFSDEARARMSAAGKDRCERARLAKLAVEHHDEK